MSIFQILIIILLSFTKGLGLKKLNYPIAHLRHNSLSVLRQYT